MLAVESLGVSNAWPRIVLAHGFTQNARCWGPFGRLLGERFGTFAVDAPGHGQSGHDDADLYEAGRLIAEAGGPGHYVGYSMGGRMLLHGALNDEIGAIRSLTLIGATPGIEDLSERAVRKADDARLAQRITEIGVPAFIDEWLAGPLFAHLNDEQTAKIRRLENYPDGLAASLVNCGAGTQEPLWSDLARIAVPVLVLAGSTDQKYCDIGQRMADKIGDNARFAAIEGGHAVHLENPQAVAQAVAAWVQHFS